MGKKPIFVKSGTTMKLSDKMKNDLEEHQNAAKYAGAGAAAGATLGAIAGGPVGAGVGGAIGGAAGGYYGARLDEQSKAISGRR